MLAEVVDLTLSDDEVIDLTLGRTSIKNKEKKNKDCPKTALKPYYKILQDTICDNDNGSRIKNKINILASAENLCSKLQKEEALLLIEKENLWQKYWILRRGVYILEKEDKREKKGRTRDKRRKGTTRSIPPTLTTGRLSDPVEDPLRMESTVAPVVAPDARGRGVVSAEQEEEEEAAAKMAMNRKSWTEARRKKRKPQVTEKERELHDLNLKIIALLKETEELWKELEEDDKEQHSDNLIGDSEAVSRADSPSTELNLTSQDDDRSVTEQTDSDPSDDSESRSWGSSVQEEEIFVYTEDSDLNDLLEEE